MRVSNERAQRLYEWFGFSRVGTLRGYYSDNGEDAVVMLTPALDEPAFASHIVKLREQHRAQYGDGFLDSPPSEESSTVSGWTGATRRSYSSSSSAVTLGSWT